MQFREGHPSDEWVFGDGGPVILLQSGAVPQWNGASGTNVSDYEVICGLEDEIQVISHHDRDMIVLSDSEWPARFIERADGVFIFQSIGHDETPEEIIDVVIAGAPQSEDRFSQADPAVRLMVGADTADNPIYDYSDRPLSPGSYLVQAYITDGAYIVRLIQSDQVRAGQAAAGESLKSE